MKQQPQKEDLRIFAMMMENQPGALSRMVGLFSQRGYNLHTLNVAPTEDPTLSRLTISLYCSQVTADQIGKQLLKLIDIVQLTELSSKKHVERELMLVKLAAETPDQRAEVKRTADIFRAQIIDILPNSYTLQVVGKASKLNAFLKVFGDTKIVEVARTGITGIYRGGETMPDIPVPTAEDYNDPVQEESTQAS